MHTVSSPIRPMIYSRPVRARAFLSVCLALVAIYPVRLWSAPPVAYDGWSVTNGVIDTSASCNLNGVNCTTLLEDDGFIQQTVDVDGRSFTRTILTDPGANGDASSLGFASENFIPKTNVSGIDLMGKQNLREAGAGFEMSAIIERSPFVDQDGNLINMLDVQINQQIASYDVTNDFALKTHSSDGDPTLGPVEGHILKIDQAVGQSSLIDPFAQEQVFYFEQREGWQGNMVNNSLALQPMNAGGSVELDGQAISWLDGDNVTLTYVNENDPAFTLETILTRDTQGITNQIGLMSLTDIALINPFP